MKTFDLDLEKMEVEEMTSMEIQETDGGFWWELALGVILSEILGYPNSYSDFQPGRDAAKSFWKNGN